MRLPDENDQRRLEGIVARLASDQDGERAAAALILTRLLKKHGKTPQDMVNGGGGSSSSGHDAANAIYWRMQHGMIAQQLRSKEKVLREVEAQRNQANHKANRLEQEAATLRSKLGAAERELAKLRAQANPGAYQTPPWEEQPQAQAKRNSWDDYNSQQYDTGPSNDELRRRQRHESAAWEDEKTYGSASAEANALLRHGAAWTAWERSFLESLVAWRGSPTANQERVLDALRKKARQHEAAKAAAAGLW